MGWVFFGDISLRSLSLSPPGLFLSLSHTHRGRQRRTPNSLPSFITTLEYTASCKTYLPKTKHVRFAPPLQKKKKSFGKPDANTNFHHSEGQTDYSPQFSLHNARPFSGAPKQVFTVVHHMHVQEVYPWSGDLCSSATPTRSSPCSASTERCMRSNDYLGRGGRRVLAYNATAIFFSTVVNLGVPCVRH